MHPPTLQSPVSDREPSAVALAEPPPRHRPAWPVDALHALLIVLAASATLPALVWLDDAFITFRYAENLLAGEGFVFNPGERVLGTTAPFFAFLLALVKAVTPWSFPEIAVGWHLAGLVAIGWLAPRLCGTFGVAAAWGRLTPFLLAWSPFGMQESVGMESTVFVALALGSILACVARRPVVMGVLAPLLCATRPDGGLLVIVLFLTWWVRERRFPTRPLVVSLLVGAPWLVFATLYYGSPVPVTVGAKVAQTPLVSEETSFWAVLVGDVAPGFLRELTGVVGLGPTLIPLTLAVLGVLAFALRRDLAGGLVVAWGVLHNAAFAIAGVAGFMWYFAPFLTQAALLASAGIAGLAATAVRAVPWLRSRSVQESLVLAVTGALTAGAMSAYERPEKYIGSDPSVPNRYAALADWFREHTPRDSSFATAEIGLLGLRSQRHVIDLFGLVTPGVADRIASGRQAEFAIERFEPDFMLVHVPRWRIEESAEELLQRDYVLIQRVEDCEVWMRWVRTPAEVAAELAAEWPGPDARVAFEDPPVRLDVAAVARELASERAGAELVEPGEASHLARLATDGGVEIVPAPEAVALTARGEALHAWESSATERHEEPSGLRLQADRAIAVSRDVELRGPIRSVAVEFETASEIPAGSAACSVYWSSSSSPIPNERTVAHAPVEPRAGTHRVEVRLPPAEIGPDETLESVLVLLHFGGDVHVTGVEVRRR